MANSDIISLQKRIIKKQDDLIDSFDKWVRFIKSYDMELAAEVVIESNNIRTDILLLKKQLEKLNKKSGIILLN